MDIEGFDGAIDDDGCNSMNARKLEGNVRL
jgi:hypothetical protein